MLSPKWLGTRNRSPGPETEGRWVSGGEMFVKVGQMRGAFGALS